MEYIAYKGKRIVAKGTLEQLSEQLELQAPTLRHYSKKAHVEIAKLEKSILYLTKAPKAVTTPKENVMPDSIKRATKQIPTKRAQRVKLTKRERFGLYYRQSQLEQKYCRDCPSNNTTLDPEKVCEGCPIYHQLRTIGRALVGKDSKDEWQEMMADFLLRGMHNENQ